MKKRRIFILLILLTIILLIASKDNDQVIKKVEVATQTEIKEQICIIANSKLKSSRVDEFFQYLLLEGDKKSVNAYYVDSYEDIDKNLEVLNNIRNVDQVIFIGIPTKTEHDSEKENWLKFVELDKFRELGKADTKWYYVATIDSIDFADWVNMNCNQWDKYNRISGDYPWYCFTHDGRFDSINDLGIKENRVSPTLLAGYGLGVYLQYKIYGNHCTNNTYLEVVSKMEDANDTMEKRSKDIEEVRRLITGEKTIIEDTNMVNVINATEAESASKKGEFSEKHFDVFDTMYAGEEGIWKLHKQENGNPIIFTGGFGDRSVSDPEMMFFEGTWEEDHWKENIYREPMNLSKVILNDYTMKKDFSGNWYGSGEDEEDEKFYLCTFDQNRKFIKKICISDILNAVCYEFDLVNKNQIIVPTHSYYGHIMNEDTDLQYRYSYIDGISLIDIDTEQITKRYDVGFPLYQIKVSDGKIIGIDYTEEWLIIINQESGEVEKSIFLGNLEFVKEETDERTWGGTKYFYDMVGDTVYFLKKSGIFALDIKDGKCNKIIDGKNLDFFSQSDMYATDFLVKNNKEMYILAVHVDEECATDFYQYIK